MADDEEKKPSEGEAKGVSWNSDVVDNEEPSDSFPPINEIVIGGDTSNLPTGDGGGSGGGSFTARKKQQQRSRRRSSACITTGRPIFPAVGATPEDIEVARQMADKIKEKYSFVEPDRGNLDDPTIIWRETKPDYTVADLQYFLGKSKNHPPGSLPLIVENMVKTWEMEATHKPQFSQWTTVNQSEYTVQANGGKEYTADEACWVGNYNWLLSTTRSDLYDSSKETFESSHGKFRYSFPEGFPWEVLEVFSGPPKVAFTWRHWARFSGDYEGNKGTGEIVNMTGFGVIFLENMKVSKIEIYFEPEKFIEVLKGERDPDCLNEQGAAYGPALVDEAVIREFAADIMPQNNRSTKAEISPAEAAAFVAAEENKKEAEGSRKCPFSHGTSAK